MSLQSSDRSNKQQFSKRTNIVSCIPRFTGTCTSSCWPSSSSIPHGIMYKFVVRIGVHSDICGQNLRRGNTDSTGRRNMVWTRNNLLEQSSILYIIRVMSVEP